MSTSIVQKFKKEEKSVTINLKRKKTKQMKKIILIIAGASLFTACDKSKSTEKPKNFMDSVSFAIGNQLGGSFREDKMGKMDSIDVDFLLAGIRAGMDSTGSFKKETIDSVVRLFQVKVNAEMEAKASKKHDDFFQGLTKNKNVKSTPSGLMYEVIKEGAGAKADANDTIVINFTWTSTEGQTIASSRPEQAERINASMVGMKGFEEAVALMAVGSKYKFYIPHTLAFGPKGASQIPPFSGHVFEVDLKDIKAMPNK